MKVSKDYQMEGQLSIFDVFNLDTQFGRMSVEPLVQTTEKISEPCLKKPSKWLTKMPMFLDLRKDRNGRQPDVSWVTDIVLLGECMTHSSGVSHKEESAYVYSLTTGGQQHQKYYLNLSEKPSIPKPTKLSQILESNPNPKYRLSAKACQGILSRANKRGKELPKLLKIALERQAQIGGDIKTYDVRISSEGTKNQRAHCYETDRSRALDTGGEKPDSNHGGVAVVGCDLYNQALTGDVTMSITGAATDPHHIPCVCAENNQQSVVCIEGNGVRESHKGDGYKESDTMYTLNTVEQHAVAYGISSYDSNGMKSPNPHSGIYEADTSRTLDLNGGSPACNQGGMAVVSYGLDRASFNQGKNAKFGFSVDEELAPSLVAKGPGGVLAKQ